MLEENIYFRTSTIDRVQVCEIASKDLSRAYAETLRVCDYEGSDSDWVGGTVADCKTIVDQGDIAQVEAAREFSKKIDQAIEVPTAAKVKRRAVNGGRVSVPRYLQGNPMCFTRNERVQDDRRPIRIFVDLGTSANIKAKTIQIKGRAMLALAQLVSRSRPVELVAVNYSNINGQDVLMRFPISLKNWATAGAVLGTAMFYREACFRFKRHALGFNRNTGIAFGNRYQGDTIPRDLLGAKEKDVVFGRSHAKTFLKADPVEWVRKEVERINAL